MIGKEIRVCTFYKEFKQNNITIASHTIYENLLVVKVLDSLREVIKQKYGEPEKSQKSARLTKRVSDNAEKKENGKYITKIVDGVKYMVLK